MVTLHKCDFVIFYPQTAATIAYANFRMAKYNAFWKDANVSHYASEDVKRQLTFLKNVGTAALPEANLTDLTATRNRMTTIYNTARICPYNNRQCNVSDPEVAWALDPHIETHLKSSTDYDEQLYLWVRNFSEQISSFCI